MILMFEQKALDSRHYLRSPYSVWTPTTCCRPRDHDGRLTIRLSLWSIRAFKTAEILRNLSINVFFNLIGSGNVNGVIFMSNRKQLRNVGKRKLLFRDQNGGSTKLCLSYGDSENCEGLPRNRWLYKELQIESWDKQEVESWNAGQSLKVLMTKVLWHDIKLWVCAKMPRPLTWEV